MSVDIGRKLIVIEGSL